MDRFDINILAALQEDGRLTNQELAERIGLSASQCSRRRVALEKDGIIESYHAILSDTALQLDVIAFVEVSLIRHSSENSAKFFQKLNDLEEVQEVYSITGESDYLIKLTATDLKKLLHILNDVLLPYEGLARVRSSIVLDRMKQTTRLPLGHL